jgi:hypothetical protein
MPLIVDAYNVLHAWRTGPAGGTVADLRALGALTRRPPFGREDAVLVCDGPCPDPDRESIELGPGVVARFAGPGRDADTMIEGLIGASSAPARLIVVSSDRRIERAARRRGCRAMASEEFIGIAMGSDRGRATTDADPPELDDQEIEDWMKRFGVPIPEPPRTPPKPPPDRIALDRTGDTRLPDSIDPAELDMERWLRDYPPPDPGMERRPSTD